MDYIIHEFARRLGDFERSQIEDHFHNIYSDEAKQVRQAMAQRKFEELNPTPKGFDFYTELAARHYGIPVEQVTTAQRENIKNLWHKYRYGFRY